MQVGSGLYDHIEVDLHGQSTSDPQFIKKSFNFDANSGLKFQFDGTFGEVSDFNILTNYADKTYLRNALAYGLYTDSGGPGLETFSAVIQRNGTYYGLYDVVEEAQSEYLERVGLDPDGALYKMGNAFDSATTNVEKKTRKYENNSDLQALVNTSSLNTSQGEAWVDDNLDLAAWVNYFAVQTLIANRDYGQKNYYLYRDTNGTQQWSLLPWDMDLSFGHQWNPSELYFDDDLVFNDGFYVYQTGNSLINRLIALPQFTQMYQRRLRSLMDEFYGPPGGNINDSEIVGKINSLISQIGTDAIMDRNHWGYPSGFSHETPAQAIARMETDFLAKRKTYLNSLAGVPASQVAIPNVTFGTIDYNPASGNQDQEYIAVVNHAATAVDISGWTLSGAIDHTFEAGTVIPAGATYYVVADVVQFKARTSGPAGNQKLFIQGNYDGRLNNASGQLALMDGTGVTIASTTYGTPSIPGDFDSSGTVDNQDYDLWRSTFGSTTDLRADANSNGTVDAADYIVWRAHLGQTSPGAGAGNAALTSLTSPQELSAFGADTSTVDSIPPASNKSYLFANQPPDSVTSHHAKSSLADSVFHTWPATRDILLIAVHANRPGHVRHLLDEKPDKDDPNDDPTDYALANFQTVQEPLLTAVTKGALGHAR